MSLLTLKHGVVLLRIDDNALLLDSNAGQFMTLNRIAYEMLRVGIKAPDEETTVDGLLDVIAVDEETLTRDFRAFTQTLREFNVLA